MNTTEKTPPGRTNNVTPRLMVQLTKDWTYFHVNDRTYVHHSAGESFPVIDTIGGCLNMAGDFIYNGIFVIPKDHFELRDPTPEEIKIATEK